MTDTLRVLGEFNDYAGLAAAIASRASALAIDVGFPPAKQPRRFAMQRVMPILQTLGIKLQLVEDSSTAHYVRRLAKRKTPCQASANVYFTLSRDFLSQIGRIGGLRTMSRRSAAKRRMLSRRGGRARMAKLTPAQRRALAQRAAQARWSRVRAYEWNGAGR